MTVEIRAHRLGATLRVAARPGAPKSRLAGEHAGALKIAVAVPPEKGRANQAVLGLLAEVLGRPKTSLELLSGELSRDKVVLCRGLDAAELTARVQQAVAGVVRPQRS